MSRFIADPSAYDPFNLEIQCWDLKLYYSSWMYNVIVDSIVYMIFHGYLAK